MQYYFISSKSIQPNNASAVTIQHSKDDKNALPLAGGLGGESEPRGIFPPQADQERNIIKMRRIRRGGFFPLRSAKRNISHREAIYRIVCFWQTVYRAEGISCAPKARKMKEQKSPARGDFTPSGMAAGRRHSEAQGVFRPLRRST